MNSESGGYVSVIWILFFLISFFSILIFLTFLPLQKGGIPSEQLSDCLLYKLHSNGIVPDDTAALINGRKFSAPNMETSVSIKSDPCFGPTSMVGRVWLKLSVNLGWAIKQRMPMGSNQLILVTLWLRAGYTKFSHANLEGFCQVMQCLIYVYKSSNKRYKISRTRLPQWQ